MNILPMTPDTAGTVNIASISGTSQAVTLAKTAVNQQIMVTSAPSGAICFIEFGVAGVTAVAATGTPILPGSIMTFTVGSTVTTAAAIGSSGTIYFTCGMGS